MIAARKEADIKYQAFLDNDKVDVNFAKLEYVYKSYISLLDRIESISKLMGERQFLTELHFIGPIFPLNAHEKYHEIKLIFHRTLYNQPNRVYNFFWIRPA